MLGNQAPHHPAVPVALEGDSVMLEGHEIKVIGPMQGDHVHATAVWVPDNRALIAGDLLFNKIFLWLGEHLPPQRKDWQDSIRNLEQLDPEIVVAGHKKPGLPDDRSSITFSLNYLETFEQILVSAENSTGLAARLRAAFPETIDILDDFILTYSTQVATGEIPPWDE